MKRLIHNMKKFIYNMTNPFDVFLCHLLYVSVFTIIIYVFIEQTTLFVFDYNKAIYKDKYIFLFHSIKYIILSILALHAVIFLLTIKFYHPLIEKLKDVSYQKEEVEEEKQAAEVYDYIRYGLQNTNGTASKMFELLLKNHPDVGLNFIVELLLVDKGWRAEEEFREYTDLEKDQMVTNFVALMAMYLLAARYNKVDVMTLGDPEKFWLSPETLNKFGLETGDKYKPERLNEILLPQLNNVISPHKLPSDLNFKNRFMNAPTLTQKMRNGTEGHRPEFRLFWNYIYEKSKYNN